VFRPTDNLDAWRRWSRDPQLIKATRVDAVAGLVDLMDAATAALPRFTAPALVLYGAKDELVPPKPIRAALAQLPSGAAQRLALYPEGHHMLLRDLGGAAGGRGISWPGWPIVTRPCRVARIGRRRPGSVLPERASDPGRAWHAWWGR
jgi:pimeloyl-ACP methyl ester carboxylesterase